MKIHQKKERKRKEAKKKENKLGEIQHKIKW
jgi:hypothetical protein